MARNNFSFCGALALGLTLVAPSVWAATFYVTNSSSYTVEATCSTASDGDQLASDTAVEISCSGSVVVQRVEADTEEEYPEHTITFDCSSDSIKVFDRPGGRRP